MTAPIVPVTGSTPIYGLEYLLEGDPAFHFRAKMERNAKKMETLMQARALAPPSAADLAALAGRVTAVETTPPTAMTMSCLVISPLSGFSPASWYLQGKVVHFRSVFQVGSTALPSSTVLATLPVAARPAANTAVPAFLNNAGTYSVSGFDMLPNGQFKNQGAIPANVYVYLDHITFLAA